jgi:hypothetical protein
MALHEFKKSEDGIEMQFVTNRLGHFLVDEVVDNTSLCR